MVAMPPALPFPSLFKGSSIEREFSSPEIRPLKAQGPVASGELTGLCS